MKKNNTQIELEQKPKRYYDLDGIRGWAAFSVMIFHILWETFGKRYPVFRSYPIAFLFNGSLDVSIFFVLSGEALSLSYWKNKNIDSIKKLAIKRYPRLTIPIFFSCLLSYLILLFHLNCNTTASEIVNRKDWLGIFLSEGNFNFFNLIKYSFLNVYSKIPSSEAFNPFLWTMRTEFFGSFILFILIYIYSKLKKKKILIMLPAYILLLKVDPFLSCFIVGNFFGYLRVNNFFENLKLNMNLQKYIPFGLFSLFFSAAFLQKTAVFNNTYYSIISSLTLFLIHSHFKITKLFNSKISIALGKISFPLYLVHFSIIISFTSWGITYLDKINQMTLLNCSLLSLLTIIISLLSALIFMKIEKITTLIEVLFLKLFT